MSEAEGGIAPPSDTLRRHQALAVTPRPLARDHDLPRTRRVEVLDGVADEVGEHLTDATAVGGHLDVWARPHVDEREVLGEDDRFLFECSVAYSSSALPTACATASVPASIRETSSRSWINASARLVARRIALSCGMIGTTASGVVCRTSSRNDALI